MRTLRTVSELDGASDLLTSLAKRGHHLALADAAGLPCIGFGSGGIYASHLRAAAALGVYDGPRDLLDQLGDSLLARWPGGLRSRPGCRCSGPSSPAWW